jgi:hypothetical protein
MKHPLLLSAPVRLGGLLALALMGLSACDTGPSVGPVWFPLRAGDVMRYTVTYSGEVSHEPEVWTLRTQGPVTFDGEKLMKRHHSMGVAYLFKVDEQGVRRVAQQTDLDREPQADAPQRWVLKAPYQVGTEWATPTVPFVLQRKNEYPRELKHSHSALMTWRIESISETVKTAQGQTFSPCMKVVGEGHLNLYTDPVNGFSDVPLISREWYCQNVGLVKFEREERVPSGFIMGGMVSAEVLP